MNKSFKRLLLFTVSSFLILSSSLTAVQANEVFSKTKPELINKDDQKLNEDIIVEYDIEGVITQETVEYGEILKNIPVKLKESYEFKYWLDKEGKIFDVNKKIYKPEYLTAIYSKLKLPTKEDDEIAYSLDNDNQSSKTTKTDTLFNESDYIVDKSEPGIIVVKELKNLSLRDLYIPAEYSNQKIILEKDFFKSILDIDSLIIEKINGNKVSYNDNSLANAFSNSTARLLNLEGLDTSNITNMEGAFSYTHNLHTLNISTWLTDSVTNMASMFAETYSLVNLDIANWNTSSVTTMNSMFFCAWNIKKLDVSKWDTSNVTDMFGLFYAMALLEELDVSNWETSNVINMNYIFYRTENLIYIDLSNWNLDKTLDYDRMFFASPEWVKPKTPLVLITKEDKLSDENFDYSLNNRIPYQVTLIKDATENGKFSDGNQLNEYQNNRIVFDTLANASIDPITYNTFMREEPTKIGHTFKHWQDEDGNTFVPKKSNTPFYRKDVYTAVYEINEYTVSYEVDGVKSSELVQHGNKPIEVPTPVKKGYTFVRWDDAKGNSYDISQEITSHQSLKAVFEINTYTVTYNVDGIETTEVVEHGNKLLEVPEPSKNGYRFIEWHDGNGKYFDVNKPITQEENLTAIFKRRFTIKYLDEGKFTSDFEVTDGDLLYGIPGDRTKEGHTFLGWFSKDGTKAEFSLIINRDYTFHSVYQLNEYTVRYDVDDVSTKELLNHGDKLKEVPTPVKEGYTFVRWIDADGKEFDVNQEITKDERLTAEFKINTYSVMYDFDINITYETVNHGDKLKEVPTPVKEGYTFVRWINADGKEFDVNQEITKDERLTAEFKINTYSVMYDFDINITYETVNHGDKLKEVPTPIKEGYTFVRWVDADGKEFDVNQVITKDERLTAEFAINEYTVSYDVDGVTSSEIVNHGSILQSVPVAVKDGYTFVKWVGANGDDFDVNEAIVQNEALVAEFAKDKDINVKPENPKDKDITAKPEEPKDHKDINPKPSTSNKGGNKVVNTGITDASLGLIVLSIGAAAILVILKKKKLNK